MFDFSKIEGLDAELVEQLNANDTLKSAVGSYVETSVSNRVSVGLEEAKTGFKSKMDAMNAKLTSAQEVAQAFEGVDPKEIGVLRSARNEAPELKAQLDALQKSYEEKQQESSDYVKKLQDMQLGNTITQSINEYNSKNQAVSVRPDVLDLVTELAKKHIQLDAETGSARVYDANGNVIATDQGAATPQDWLTQLREERPTLFNSPTGSGATGSKTPSGSAKTLTREQFSALAPAEQAVAARTHTITD